jgi:hypothetical protein
MDSHGLFETLLVNRHLNGDVGQVQVDFVIRFRPDRRIVF